MTAPVSPLNPRIRWSPAKPVFTTHTIASSVPLVVVTQGEPYLFGSQSTQELSLADLWE